MALTNQPYLPMYVKDWLTNNKLKLISLQAHGLMINVMCLMHKEDDYGKLLLHQKFKQNESKVQNFALMFARLLPFEVADMIPPLQELIDTKVLVIEGDLLICDRMVKDSQLSLIRAKSGSKGGKSIKNFALANSEANIQANTEYENETAIESENEIKHEFQDYIIKGCPKILKLEIQLTAENCLTLESKYRREAVFETIDAMENYKPLLKKYSNVYRTLNTWLSRDDKNLLPKERITVKTREEREAELSHLRKP